MISINKVSIQGRAGSDPDFKEFTGGKVANFSVATTESYKKGDGYEEKTTWHKVKCFGSLAEFVKKHVVKGMIVYVEGTIDVSNYEKDGIKRTDVTIKANSIIPDWQSVEKKPKPEISHNPEPQVDFEIPDEGGDDLPF